MSRTKKRISGQQAAKILGVTTENVRNLAKAGILSSVVVLNGKKKTRYYYESEVLARKNAATEYINLAEDTEKVLESAKLLNKSSHRSEEEARRRLKQNKNWQIQHSRICDIFDTAIACVNRNGILSDREKDILHRWIRLEQLEMIARVHGISYTRITEIIKKALKKLLQAKTISEQNAELEANILELEKQNTELIRRIEYLKTNTTKIGEKEILVLSSEEYAMRQLLLSDVSVILKHYWEKTPDRWKAQDILKKNEILTVADFVSKSAETIKSYGLEPSSFISILTKLKLYFSFNVIKYGIVNKNAEDTLFDDNMNIYEPEKARIKTVLLTRLKDIGLSTRTFNCLKIFDIDTLADVCQLSQTDLRRIRNMGAKSQNEITYIVEKMGLRFGMDLKQYGLTPKTIRIWR